MLKLGKGSADRFPMITPYFKNSLSFSALLAGALSLQACGGGSQALSSNNQTKKESASADKEDESADEPAEIAGAFLDDGQAASSKIGIVMKDSDGKKFDTSSAEMTVKYIGETGDPKLIPSEKAPAESAWNLILTMPSDYAKTGSLEARLADPKKPRRGKIKISALKMFDPSATGDALGTTGISRTNGAATNAGTTTTQTPVQAVTRDTSLADPGITSIHISARWTPPLSTSFDFTSKMFPSELCSDTGAPVQHLDRGFVGAFGSLADPTLGDSVVTPTVDNVCFKRYYSADTWRSLSAQALGQLFANAGIGNGGGAFIKQPYPDKSCFVIKSDRSYMVVTQLPAGANGLDQLAKFVRAYHCSSEASVTNTSR